MSEIIRSLMQCTIPNLDFKAVTSNGFSFETTSLHHKKTSAKKKSGDLFDVKSVSFQEEMGIVEGAAAQSHIHQRKAPFCQNSSIDIESHFTQSYKTTPTLYQMRFSIFFQIRLTLMEKNQK